LLTGFTFALKRNFFARQFHVLPEIPDLVHLSVGSVPQRHHLDVEVADVLEEDFALDQILEMLNFSLLPMELLGFATDHQLETDQLSSRTLAVLQ
jgi:hypothetical protein